MGTVVVGGKDSAGGVSFARAMEKFKQQAEEDEAGDGEKKDHKSDGGVNKEDEENEEGRTSQAKE